MVHSLSRLRTALFPIVRWLWGLGLGMVLVSGVPARSQLTGTLELVGENWTYREAGFPEVEGILVRPTGEGPFPGVLISHGKGGTTGGFSLPKAREMAGWGMVAIGPRYTHSPQDPDFGDLAQEGARPENLRRAEVSLEILRHLDDVDRNRLACYGNSMGGYITIALAARRPEGVRVAAVTAAGVVPVEGAAAPSAQLAGSIRIPFLLLHGTADTTVLPATSADLEGILNSGGVGVRRVLFQGVGHNLHQDRSAEVYGEIQSWFSGARIFQAGLADRPRGIYILDSAQGTSYGGGTLRDANIRDLPFVSGYALRAAWEQMEPTSGTLDFTIVSNGLQKLPAGQKLSLTLVPQDPPDIGLDDRVTSWLDTDRQGSPVVRAVPWDPTLRERRRLFLEALSQQIVDGVALRDHPDFHAVNAYLPGGFTGIRDPNSQRLDELPGYTRAKFHDAVLDELRALTDCFPNQYVQIGFWKVTDSEGGTASWEELRGKILQEFDGIRRPRVGFYMENLAASRPSAGSPVVTGYPVTDFGAALYLSRDQTWTAFQALTSWTQPFTGPEKVANATAMDGIEYAFTTFGCTYVELYLNDVTRAEWGPGLTDWSQRLLGLSPNAAVDPSDWQFYE